MSEPSPDQQSISADPYKKDILNGYFKTLSGGQICYTILLQVEIAGTPSVSLHSDLGSVFANPLNKRKLRIKNKIMGKKSRILLGSPESLDFKLSTPSL